MAQTDSSEVFDRALELEPAKRLSLAARLLDSVEEPEEEGWASAWGEELEARWKLMESGEDAGESWEAVRLAALAGLKGR